MGGEEEGEKKEREYSSIFNPLQERVGTWY